jgi:hypothetical protein
VTYTPSSASILVESADATGPQVLKRMHRRRAVHVHLSSVPHLAPFKVTFLNDPAESFRVTFWMS